MSVPTEDGVMSSIGLGNHYTWFNGSSSCAGIRRAAADKLADALTAAGLTPIPGLIDLVKRVADAEDPTAFDDMCCLTTTWQCAADVIRAHMNPTPETVEWCLGHYEPPGDDGVFVDTHGNVHYRAHQRRYRAVW